MEQQTCSTEIIALGHKLAGLCRPVLQQTFRQGLTVKVKSNTLPVTQVDLAVETLVRDYLAKARSEDGVIGEEFEPHNETADYVWVVDPIIGTKNFIAGNLGFCFVIGCMYKGKPIFGLVDQPITGDRWIGARGYASTLNDNRIALHACNDELRPLRIAVTDKGLKNSRIEALIELTEKDGAIVLRGGDETLIAMLSGGWLDAVIDDTADVFAYWPYIPILSGAGGVILDKKGDILQERHYSGIMAAGNRATLERHILPKLKA